MNSQIQIDLKEKIKPFFGAEAKIWDFDRTLGRMVIRVWKFDKEMNKVTSEIFIVCLLCTYMSGPFRWNDVDIQFDITAFDESPEVTYRIFDKNAGFELRGEGGLGIMEKYDE